MKSRTLYAALVLKGWSLDPQQLLSPSPGNSLDMQKIGCSPKPVESETLGTGLAICVLTSPQMMGLQVNLRAIAMQHAAVCGGREGHTMQTRAYVITLYMYLYVCLHVFKR